MTITHEDAGGYLPKLEGYHDLAERELRALEDTVPDTPPAMTIAHGFAALTYAVLALRETCQDQATDVSDTLARLTDSATEAADYAGRITWAAEEAADYAGRLAYAADKLPWQRRLAWLFRSGRQDSGPEEP